MLTPWEQRAFAAIEAAANEGRRFPTADDLMEAIGCESHASTVNVVARLELRGLITVERFQRERVGTIVATGKRTAEPKTRAKHWRERVEHLPEPLHLIRRRDQKLFQAVLLEARRERKSPTQMLARLVAEAMQARLIQSGQVVG
jgi:hypothetical protein